jgi:hypothetical protein
VLEPVLQPDGLDDQLDPCLVELPAGQGGRQSDVFLGGQCRDQVEGLEDEAHPVPPELGEALVVERAEVGVADEDLS